MPEQKRNARREWLLVTALFALSACVRFALADYPRRILTYPDETLYFSLAESLASGRGIGVYNLPTSFQKIVYPLLLAPAFLIGDRWLRLRAVALINALCVSSGVFPTYLLARRFLERRGNRLALCALYAVSSDLCYSMTFMSESAFLPLGLWGVAGYAALFAYRGPAKRRRALCAATGALTYLLYLTKETSVAFLAGYALVALWEACGERDRRAALRARLGDAAALLGAFLALFALMKATAFSGLGAYYDQSSADVLFEPGRARYLVYGFGYYLISATVAFGVLPVALPALLPDGMDADARRLHRFLLCVFALTAAGVAYTITIREDYLGALPRAHLRYICHLFIPFCALLLSRAERAADVPRRRAALTAAALAAFSLFSARFWHGEINPSQIDYTLLKFADGLGGGQIRALCLLGGAYSLLVLLALFKWRRGLAPLLLAPLLAVQLVNDRAAVRDFRENHGISPEVCAEIDALTGALEAYADGNVLVLAGDEDRTQDAFDLYLTGPNVYTVYAGDYAALQGPDGLDLNAATLPRHFFGGDYEALRSIRCVITPLNYAAEGAEEKREFGDADFNYRLYETPGGSALPRIRRLEETADGGEK